MTLGVRLKRSHMIDGGWLEGNARSQVLLLVTAVDWMFIPPFKLKC